MKTITNSLKSKTLWAMAFMSFLTVLEVNMQLVTPLLPVEFRPYLPLVWAPVMTVMRFLTNNAIAEK